MGSNTVSLALILTYVYTYIPCIHTYVPLLKLHLRTGKNLGLLKQTTVAM